MDETIDNCPNFSYAETHQLDIVNLVGSNISFVASFVTIALVLVTKSYRVFIHRLTAYLAVPVCLFSLALLLHMGAAIRVGADWVTYVKHFCTANGFFLQYISWVETVVACWINAYVTLLAMLRVKINKRKHEVAGIVLSIFLPLILSWEPLVHNVYGPAGAWCWIKVGGDNCTTDSGLWYQIGLYYGPLIFLSALNIAEVLGVAVKLWVGACQTDGSLQRCHIAAIKEVIPICIYPGIFFFTFLFGLAHRILSSILLVQGKHQIISMWITFVLLISIKGLYLPIAFVYHPHIRSRLLCKRRSGSGRDSSINAVVGLRHDNYGSLGASGQCTATGGGIYSTQTHYIVPAQSNCSHTPLIIKSTT